MKLLLLQLKTPLSQPLCVHMTNTKCSMLRKVLYAKRPPSQKHHRAVHEHMAGLQNQGEL